MRNVGRGGFLFTDRGEPRLLLPGLLGVIASFLVALAILAGTGRPRTVEDRAAALERSGHPGEAERIYADLVRERPTVPLVIALLEAHDAARVRTKLLEKLDDQSKKSMGLPDTEAPLPEAELDTLLSGLPEDVSLAGTFYRRLGDRTVPAAIHELMLERATRDPPMPWANHLLAEEAEKSGKHAEAAAFFEKEGTSFYERRQDVDTALQIWITLDAWNTVRERLSHERVAAAVSPQIRYRLAVHDQDWRAAIRWLPAVWMPHVGGPALAMSGIAALGWAFFCARLGKVGQRVGFRLPMYLIAFVLGVASVFPTVLLIAVEEAKLRLVETGDPARDILFFVFGVGFREEAAKLLLFLPLLPILRRWGDKLDVLVCGAMVGLGFAAEENLNYLAQANLQTGLGRFLTANFFHMAMTGTLASALDDFVTDREKNATAFSQTALFVIAIHGGYDFLLSHEEYGGSYFAMTAFVLLTRLFLAAVDTARRRADRGITPAHAFIVAVSVVTGVSFAYAVTALGTVGALLVMGGGLLGEAIIVYIFVRTLRAM